MSSVAFTLVAEGDAYEHQPSTQDLRIALEKGTDELKLDTLRRIVVSTLNGQPQPTLLMPIIQFVLPSKNKHIKKLLQYVLACAACLFRPASGLTTRSPDSFYWEICPKLDDNGKLKQEMILVWYVCSALWRPRGLLIDPSLQQRNPQRSRAFTGFYTSAQRVPDLIRCSNIPTNTSAARLSGSCRRFASLSSLSR